MADAKFTHPGDMETKNYDGSFYRRGTGAADLITVRGLKLIQSCPVPVRGVPGARRRRRRSPDGAEVIDTAPLHLDQIMGKISDAHYAGLDVARVHSGDPSVYGAIAEQMRRLDMYEIPHDVTPGVPAFAAAAAVLGQELTLPEIAQTVIVTRTDGKASPHAGGRGLGIPRRTSGNAGHSSLHSQSRQGGAGTGSSLWSRLSGRCRLSGNLA